MKQEIVEIIRVALENLQKRWGIETIPDIEVEVPKNEAMGDIASTVAMRLSKALRKPPRKIAEDIIAEIHEREKDGGRADIFDAIEIAGAGFINFRLKRDFFYRSLGTLLNEKHSSLRRDIGKGQRLQVEFVSANPTGPLHIGHGRGAAVGNALCNLLRAAGYELEREFYINDAGLQVKLLGESVYARYCEICINKYPHETNQGEWPFPADGYKGDYINDIAKELDEQYQGTLWAKGMSENKIPQEVFDYSYQTMLENIKRDLKDFGVTFDTWQSEKELHDQGKVQEALDSLDAKGLIYEKDGAVWFSSSRFGDDKDRVVRKQDGEYTYFASDICYHKEKLDRGFDTIIDIWGADHHGYIPRIGAVLEAFDLEKEKFRVILIQMVTLLRHGQPVQMSKRAGTFITLREVLDEVGPDITKFIFLTRKADSHLDFDIDIAKEQSSENPVFYVQYAFARISSLFRQANEKGVHGVEGASVGGDDLSFLTEDDDVTLIKKLLQYPMIFEGAVMTCEPHRITYYLQELASLFHAYYYKHRIITDDMALTRARLSLCRGVKIVLEEGLNMLGVSAPERM